MQIATKTKTLLYAQQWKTHIKMYNRTHKCLSCQDGSSLEDMHAIPKHGTCLCSGRLGGRGEHWVQLSPFSFATTLFFYLWCRQGKFVPVTLLHQAEYHQILMSANYIMHSQRQTVFINHLVKLTLFYWKIIGVEQAQLFTWQQYTSPPSSVLHVHSPHPPLLWYAAHKEIYMPKYTCTHHFMPTDGKISPHAY